jgi:hypothetical protein
MWNQKKEEGKENTILTIHHFKDWALHEKVAFEI